MLEHHPTQKRALHERLTAPLLFLSSAEADWDDLLVRAYHEPTQLEGWLSPPVPQIALILLTSGQMLLEQQQANGIWRGFSMRQSDLILRPGGSVIRPVRWRSLSAQPMQTLHIDLESSLFSRTATEIAESDPASLTLYGRAGFQDPLLAQIGLALQHELEQPTPAGKLYAQTAAQMLAVHLLRYYTTPTPRIHEPAQGLTPRQVSLVTEYVLAHLDQDSSLSALAQHIGLSPYHFARQFRRTTGQSPHQFVLDMRIDRARQLLRETTLQLAEIALASGFANQSHLTQAFKRSVGLTPATYRRDHTNCAHF